ncbi:ash family protein [Escherichia coli]|uniref:host cell division inhibitor Icd-like protein n=1 Tax=Escherichia coli TaxID=562 RepID=UPI000E1FF58B|nr:host cell division inhibitor Icd-like protein [Escherichia coli]EFK2996293.1 ash family protein [Escherichia coli]EFO4250440.1 host cell division inhibitor Icd-like protein [Escherichia coli]EJC2652704.1 host cell division inhibitor Icd-like protein [Escherichia coli]HCO3849945.1 host cell division inhibitor Icd-like protein [Escherichia coli]
MLTENNLLKKHLTESNRKQQNNNTPHKTGVGIATPQALQATQTPQASFLLSFYMHALSMVGCMGPTFVGLVPCNASCCNLLQSTASELATSGGGYSKPTLQEAAFMATTPTLARAQTAFIWRFIAFGVSGPQIINVTAWTEREARNRCPSGCVAVFAARIRQGVSHD